LTLNCDKTITLEVFLGKDNYIWWIQKV
jgi:hypothetical protein